MLNRPPADENEKRPVGGIAPIYKMSAVKRQDTVSKYMENAVTVGVTKKKRNPKKGSGVWRNSG